MNKRNSYIAAAAIVIAGTAGTASWLAIEADELKPQISTTRPSADRAAVSETEAFIPVAPVLDAPAAEAEPAAPTAVAVPMRVRPQPAPQRQRSAAATPRPAPANFESGPVNHEPAEPRTEPAERAEPVEPMEREPRFIDIVVPSNVVLGLRLSSTVSSDSAEVEDRVEATVTRDVIAAGRVAIPAGTRVLGSVNGVTRGGRFREQARLSVRFHTLVLADGSRESVRVDSIVREGDAPARESAAKIGGGAVGGAILGGIMGGRKGAILGGAAGAGAGTAAVAAGGRSVATLSAGSPLSVRLAAPVTIRREQ